MIVSKDSDKRFQGALSNDYDLFRLVSLHEDEIQETVGTAIKNYFKQYDNKKIEVLELGSGTGLTTQVILECDARTHITGIDNEDSMVQQFKNKLKSEIKQGRVSAVQEDCLQYLKHTKDGSFDVVASAWTLHNFHRDYRRDLLREIYRVMKKGGLFVNADKYALDDPIEQKKESAAHIRRFDEFTRLGRPDLKEKWTKHYIEDEKPEIIMYEGEAKEEMKKIGFVEIKVPYRKSINATITASK